MDNPTDGREPQRLDEAEQTALNDMQWLWGDTYLIYVSEDALWCASPLNELTTPLTADSSWELRMALRQDYQQRRSLQRAATDGAIVVLPLTEQERESLWKLRIHWQGNFHIAFEGGTWRAAPLAGGNC